VHLSNTAALPATDALAAEAVTRSAQIVRVIQTASGRAQPPALTVVTRGAIAIDARDRADGLHGATLPGLIKVAALEHPELSPRLIDIDAACAASSLADALLAPGLEIEQALREGRRWLPRLVQAPVQHTAANAIAGNGYHLITGGHGGIGLALAEWLIAQGARQIALIGRRVPDVAASQRIAAWRQRGITVDSQLADVANEPQLRAAIAALSEQQPIVSVYHAAGILSDATISQQNADKLAASFMPKIQGAWNLHRATLDHPLEHFVLFSSAAALLGSAGQAAHAAANAWLDTFAWYRRGLGRPACSIDWGAWAEIGAAARLEREDEFLRQGFGALAPEAAFARLGEIMSSDTVQAGVIALDIPRFLSQRPAWALFEALDHRRGSRSEAPLAPIDLAAVLEELALVLGSHPADELDPDRELVSFGLDSLATLDLRNRLQRRTGLALSATLMLDYPTARLLAEHLASFTVTAGPQHTIGDSLIDTLSEGELDALIAGLSSAPHTSA
jgi:NAD(P)-dependent dehydrogenase (short-subunit alcohol dehydrogenase family)/aryl carrier-like protein